MPQRTNILFGLAMILSTPFFGQDLTNLGKADTPRFQISDQVWPTEISDMSVCLWKDDKTAAITITIDDNNEQDLSFWDAMCQKFGFHFTWFVITDTDPELTVKCWSCFRDLSSHGHAIEGHGDRNWYDQPKDGEKNPSISEYQTILQTTKRNINTEIPGKKCTTYAYPWGEGQKNMAEKEFIAIRGVVGLPNKTNELDFGYVNSISNKHIIKDSTAILKYTLPILNDTDQIQGTNYYRGWLSVHFHDIPTEDRIKTEVFLAHLKGKEDVLWLATFPQVAMYAQEYATHKIENIKVRKYKLSFRLSDSMKDTFFHEALTIKIRIPASWKNPIAIQKGKNLETKSIVHNGNVYLLVNAIPDRGKVRIISQQ